MSMSQKQGVFSAIVAVLAEVNKSVLDGVKTELTDTERASVTLMVAQGLHDGDIVMSAEAKAKYDTVDKLKTKYVPGLVSNWLRKDLRLNGGTPYKAKNPGSRAGQGDEQLKNLKLLKQTIDDPAQQAKVQEAIDSRIEEIKKEKASKIEVDMSKIPAELLEQLGFKK